ncbi:MerR family transcriptional regulator [Streptomonospora sediminis]
MTVLHVSELAERSGVPASTLRFYEQQGLLRADRSPAGYRLFTEDTVDRLAFIATAKLLGLDLGEIARIMAVRDQGSCARVRADLRPRVETRIAQARARSAELAAFTARLEQARAHLRGPDPAGPCSPACANLHTRTPERPPAKAAEAAARRLLPLISAAGGGRAVACTLDATAQDERLREWERVLDGADRTPIKGGLRLHLSGAADTAELARLVAAERRCCNFIVFDLHLGERTVLEVRATTHAQDLLAEIFAGRP